MRLFIAINFDESVKRRLMDIQSRLKSLSASGNFTKENNLHLTLAFLGELPPGKLPAIKQAMDDVSTEGFELNFSGTGFFRRDGGDIWWVGIEKNNTLTRLQRELSDKLRQRDFVLESREFKPHLTIARELALKEGIDEAKLSEGVFPYLTKVEGFSLMKSERIDGRLTYTELYSKKL